MAEEKIIRNERSEEDSSKKEADQFGWRFHILPLGLALIITILFYLFILFFVGD